MKSTAPQSVGEIVHPHLSCCPGMSVLKFAYKFPERCYIYRCECCGRRGFAIQFGFIRQKKEAKRVAV